MVAIDDAVGMLVMSLKGCQAVLAEGEAPLQRRLTWLASELERLAGEAYRLADEADTGPECIPGWDGPLPGFDSQDDSPGGDNN